ADRLTARLNPIACTTDVVEFEAGLSAAPRATTGVERAQRLTETLSQYGGDLLPACLDEWVIPERLCLTERFHAALAQLVSMLERRGDLAGAISWARRAVTADPLREEAQRELIRLLAAAGQAGAARR